MTGPTGPQRPEPTPPRSPQAAGGRPATDDDGSAVLGHREEQQLEQSVRVVGRSGRSPVVVGALVAAAFLLGLLRPWDLLGSPAADRSAAPAIGAGSPVAGVATPGSGAGDPRGTAAGTPGRTQPPAPSRALTCAFPSQWRSATIEDWNGRPARVWRAAEVGTGNGPEDPSIPFEPIVAASITAIGWCAPVDGSERPPLSLTASLYRIRDGIASPVQFDRLEPAEPDALGELWTPVPRGVGNRPPWAHGRYVIELRSASGSYVRYLGLELLDRLERPSPSSGASPGASPGSMPAASPEPASPSAQEGG